MRKAGFNGPLAKAKRLTVPRASATASVSPEAETPMAVAVPAIADRGVTCGCGSRSGVSSGQDQRVPAEVFGSRVRAMICVELLSKARSVKPDRSGFCSTLTNSGVALPASFQIRMAPVSDAVANSFSLEFDHDGIKLPVASGEAEAADAQLSARQGFSRWREDESIRAGLVDRLRADDEGAHRIGGAQGIGLGREGSGSVPAAGLVAPGRPRP